MVGEDPSEQLQAFSTYFLCDVHVRQLQLDELYAVLREIKDGEISEDQALKRLERSRHWVWTVIDPESKLLLVTDRRTPHSGDGAACSAPSGPGISAWLCATVFN